MYTTQINRTFRMRWLSWFGSDWLAMFTYRRLRREIAQQEFYFWPFLGIQIEIGKVVGYLLKQLFTLASFKVVDIHLHFGKLLFWKYIISSDKSTTVYCLMSLTKFSRWKLVLFPLVSFSRQLSRIPVQEKLLIFLADAGLLKMKMMVKSHVNWSEQTLKTVI